MSVSQRQSTAKQASVKQAAQRPPVREMEQEEGVGKLLGFQNSFGNQATKRAGDACPNLAACPTGGACHECQQKGANPSAALGAGTASSEMETAPAEIASPRAEPTPAPSPTTSAPLEAPGPETASQAPSSAASPAPATSAASPAQAASHEVQVLPPQASSFLVDDPMSATEPAQMSKELFLSELRAHVTDAAEGEMAGTGRTARDCPWIETSFAYYRQRNAAQLEAALRRYAPETSNARSAAEYMPAVAERVRRAVAAWASTGEITGVPAEVSGRAAALLAAGAAPSAAASVSSLLFKAKPGGARAPQGLEALQQRLGEGEALDAPVRSRMEAAFGTSLGGVRVHRDAHAAALSSEVNARAFALGDHVAFGAGEYRPGNVVGDALIAHELAHVLQQGGGSAGGSADYGSLEADADRSAAGAVASMWAGAREGAAGLAERTGPALRSGLRLQRCKENNPPPVCAMPTAVENGPFHAPIDTADKVGMEIAITLRSSTGNNADLAPVQDSEQVGDSFDHTGSLSGHASIPAHQSTFMSAVGIPNDRHAINKAFVIDRADNHGGSGSLAEHQLDIFTHPTCAVTTPTVVPNSGYRINHITTAGPGTLIKHKVEKKAEACTVEGYTTAAGPSPTYSDEVAVRP